MTQTSDRGWGPGRSAEALCPASVNAPAGAQPSQLTAVLLPGIRREGTAVQAHELESKLLHSSPLYNPLYDPL